MTIEVEDAVAKAREAKALMDDLTNILNNANANLVKTFGHLAHMVEEAAECYDLERVHEGLELIDRLADLGFSARSVND